MRPSSPWFRPIRIYFLLVLIGLLPVLPILIKGSPILNNDMLVAYFCYFWDFHKNWSWSHPLVFWSSSYQCGMPMHAYWQSGYLYPITWVFFGPMSPLYGIYLFYAFHFSLGIFGFLKLGPFLRLHRGASLWAGICFSLSGTMLARYEHATFLSGWTWMPMVLAAYFSLRDRPGLKSLFIYSGSVALQALGGHPQASITTAMLITAFTIADFFRRNHFHAYSHDHTDVNIHSHPHAHATEKDIGINRVTDRILPSRRFMWILGGHLLAILYCSPMLVPFLHLLDETSRFDGVAWEEGKPVDASATEKLESGVFGFEKFSTGGMRPLHLLSLAAPNILGSPSNASWWGGEAWGEVFVYLGGLGLFFCFFASWKRANRDMRILWIVGIFGLWIAFGKHLGASQILYQLPILNNFRRPARFVILFVLAIAPLSAHGLQLWLARPRGRKFSLWMAAGTFLAAAVFLFICFKPVLMENFLHALARFRTLDPGKDYGQKLQLLLGRAAWDGAFLWLSALAIWFVARRPRTRLSLLFLVLLADLLRLHWDHFYLFPSDYYRRPPLTAKLLDEKTEPFWRVSHYLEYPDIQLWQMHNDPLAHFELLEREKLALTFGIHAVFGYRHVDAHLPLIWNWESGLTPADKGARYLFSNVSLKVFQGDSLLPLGTVKGMNVFELKDWKPRIENLSVANYQNSPDSRVKPRMPCESGFSGNGNLCVQEIHDGSFSIKGNFQASDTLLIRERAYRGWRYRIAGGSWTQVQESPQHFLRIPILQASKEVEVEFSPTDFYALSALCLIVSGFIPAFCFWLRKRK